MTSGHSSTLREFGLIGYPLGHSFSKGYFAEKFKNENITDAVYENFPIERISEFYELCAAHPNLRGLNVTIPHKTSILPFLDELSDEAQKIGAVNTILFSGDKKIGFNTDAWGFEKSLVPLLRSPHTAALVLGTGGASKAVVYVLDKLGIRWKYISREHRNDDLSYGELSDDIVASHPLIINTTPLGMFPAINASPPLPYSAITAHHLLYDLVYNPSVTRFMQAAIDRGAKVKNGLEMLQLQAEKAWEIWNK